MNEKIKKFAKQASEELIGMSCTRDRWKEKFAELIVKECSQVCLDRAQKPRGNALINDEAVFCALMIRRHFGVENE